MNDLAGENAAAMIECSGLTKVFEDPRRGRVVAADNVTFTCRPGMVLGLLGPNGAGKTTTLRMLSTVIKPTSGTAKVAGYDIVQEPQRVRERIGFLSGETGLYGRLTAREMVKYFGQLYGMTEERIEERITELFDMLDIKSFENTRNDKLSSGMKQRVSIARTLVHDPPVLILDEPTAGLDVIASRTIVDFIRRCRDMGKCILFSTHIMSEAQRLCDEVAIIHKGRIWATGTVKDLMDRTGETTLEDAFLRIVGD